jgi:hypothetical protein
MITMCEFKLNLDGTPEEQAQIRKDQLIRLSTSIDLPFGAVIRRVNTRILQHKRSGIHPETKELGTFIVPEECVYLWAECGESPRVSRRFQIIQAGVEVPDLPYVGTFLLNAGAMVLHMYGPEQIEH